MKHLEEHILESVARKKTGKYTYGEYLKKGDRVVLKTMEEIEKLPEFGLYRNMPVVNDIVIWPFMQERLGGEVTVDSTIRNNRTDQWFFKEIDDRQIKITWPVEVIDRLVY